MAYYGCLWLMGTYGLWVHMAYGCIRLMGAYGLRVHMAYGCIWLMGAYIWLMGPYIWLMGPYIWLMSACMALYTYTTRECIFLLSMACFIIPPSSPLSVACVIIPPLSPLSPLLSLEFHRHHIHIHARFVLSSRGSYHESHALVDYTNSKLRTSRQLARYYSSVLLLLLCSTV